MSDARDDTAGPEIRVQPGGPYVVTGGVPVARRSVVYSEHGEPLAWRRGATVSTDERVVLCRCGASGHKPFCDGSHERVGFEGGEAAPTDTYDERARTLVGVGVSVRDDRSLCEHAGFCGNRVSNVWDMVEGGVTADSVARAQVIAMVERCPSGALTYRVEPEEEDLEPDLPAAIAVVDDGPLYVTGGLPVTRTDGAPFETRNRMTLCRCGASATKPLCDGSHKAAGFTDR